MFVDATGWRARFGRRLGLGAGAVLVVFLGALGLGMATGPSVPLTSWSDPSPDPPGGPGAPAMPPATPDEGSASPEPTRRAAGGPGGGQGEGAAPPAAPRATPPTPASTASHPGNGKSTANPPANPPAWGRKKKDR